MIKQKGLSIIVAVKRRLIILGIDPLKRKCSKMIIVRQTTQNYSLVHEKNYIE